MGFGSSFGSSSSSIKAGKGGLSGSRRPMIGGWGITNDLSALART
jgi:hypothetical protein